MSEADRRERADARRARGLTVERIETSGEPASDDFSVSIEDRLTAMTRLCNAVWRATAQPLPPCGRARRASLPGEVYFPEHVSA